MIFVGLDIGGTKTRCLGIDLARRRCASCIDEGVNPAVVPRERVLEVVRRCVNEVLNQLNVDGSMVELVGIGSAGVGKGFWISLFRDALKELGIDPNAVFVFEDYRVLHASCFLGGDGIAMISGTGSSVFGKRGEREVKVGGWGHLLDDYGSAYQVGRDGMEAALRYYDGRGPKTKLLDYLLEYLSIESVELVIPKVYGATNPKQLIAGFAPYVVRAALEGDEVANKIIERCVKEIVIALKASAERLGFDEPSICMEGGFWRGARHVIEPLLREELARTFRSYRLVEPSIGTTCAAIVLALQASKRSDLVQHVVELCRTCTE